MWSLHGVNIVYTSRTYAKKALTDHFVCWRIIILEDSFLYSLFLANYQFRPQVVNRNGSKRIEYFLKKFWSFPSRVLSCTDPLKRLEGWCTGDINTFIIPDAERPDYILIKPDRIID